MYIKIENKMKGKIKNFNIPFSANKNLSVKRGDK